MDRDQIGYLVVKKGKKEGVENERNFYRKVRSIIGKKGDDKRKNREIQKGVYFFEATYEPSTKRTEAFILAQRLANVAIEHGFSADIYQIVVRGHMPVNPAYHRIA